MTATSDSEFPLDFFIQEKKSRELNIEQSKVEKERTIFDLFKALSQTKELCSGDVELYLPILMNKMFSKFFDTLHYSNEMNRYTKLPIEAQIDYYLLNIIPKNRFRKWPKKSKEDELSEMISKTFQLNKRNADEYVDMMKLFKVDIELDNPSSKKELNKKTKLRSNKSVK